MSTAENEPTRDANSSIAKGSPSSLKHSRATSRSCPSSRKSGSADCARSTNSCTDAEAAMVAVSADDTGNFIVMPAAQPGSPGPGFAEETAVT